MQALQGVQNGGHHFKFARFDVAAFVLYTLSKLYELLTIVVFLL